jgi:hypothetical protein
MGALIGGTIDNIIKKLISFSRNLLQQFYIEIVPLHKVAAPAGMSLDRN